MNIFPKSNRPIDIENKVMEKKKNKKTKFWLRKGKVRGGGRDKLEVWDENIHTTTYKHIYVCMYIYMCVCIFKYLI